MDFLTAETKIAYIVIDRPPKQVCFKGPRARKSVGTSLLLSLPYLIFCIRVRWLGPLLFLAFFLIQLSLLYDYPRIPLILVVPRSLFSRVLDVPVFGQICRALLKAYDFLFHHGWFVVRRQEPRYAAEEIFYFCLDREKSGYGLLFFLFYENRRDYVIALSSWLEAYYPGSRVILVSRKGMAEPAEGLWKSGVLFLPLDPKKFEGFGDEYRWKKFWLLAEAVLMSEHGALPIRNAAEGKRYVQIAAPPFSIGGRMIRDMEGALRDVEAPVDRYIDFMPSGSAKAVRFVRLPKGHPEAFHDESSSPVEARTGIRPDVYNYKPEDGFLSPLRMDPLNVLVFCSDSVEEIAPPYSMFAQFVEVKEGGKHVAGLKKGDFRVEMRAQTEVVEVIEVFGENAQVILVLDVSSSMAGKKLQDLKKASIGFLDKIRGIKVGLVAFDERVRLKLAPSDVGLVIESISSLQAGGGTDIGKGVSSALDLLKGPGTIVLITDGNGPIGEKVLERAKKMDVRVFCVSIGEDADLDRLRDIASATGGVLYSAVEAEELEDIYGEIASRIASGYLVKWIALGRIPDRAPASILARFGGEEKLVFRGEVRRI